jgi:uncharacterized protein YuzE
MKLHYYPETDSLYIELETSGIALSGTYQRVNPAIKQSVRAR